MMTDQFAPIDKPYWKQWQERMCLKREIVRRVIVKLQVLDEHDLIYGVPKPVKPVKVKPRKKGKKARGKKK